MSAFGDFLDGGAAPVAPNQEGAAIPSAGTAFGQFLDAQPQMGGFWREPALAASSLLKGLAAPAGAAGEAAAVEMGLPPDLTPTPANTVAGLKGAGLVDRPGLTPQTEGEKILASGSEGVGQSLPFAAVAGLPALAAGLGGGVGSMYGARALPDHPVIGSLAGGVLGGGVVGGASNLAARGINALRGAYGPMGQAYRDAGIPLRLTGDVSEKPVLQNLQSFAMRAPGGAGRTQNAASTVVGAFGRSVEDTANNLGSSSTLEQAGNAVKNETQQWLKNFKSGNETAWNAVDNAVGPTAPVNLSATQTLLNDLKTQAGGNEAAESFLKSPLAKQIGGIVDDAQKSGGAVPWQTAKAIRSRIGEYLENPSLIADAGGAQAKRLWGSLTNDMRDTVAASPNQNAQQLFDLANTYTAKGHDFIENVLTPYVSKGAKAADVARGLLGTGTNGGETLDALRLEMPKAADELAAFKLRDMGLSNPGQQNAEGTAVSPSTFLTDWNKLSPEAKEALYASPATRAKINAQATVAQGIRETAKNINHSGTSPALLTYEMLNGLFERAPAGAAAGFYAHGPVGGLAGGLAGAVGPMIPGRVASYFGANRLLAPLMAARGPGGFLGQSPMIGAATTLPFSLAPANGH